MRQIQKRLAVQTTGPGLREITPAVHEAVRESAITCGLVTLYCQHSSASLVIQENADPDVRADLETFFVRLVPEGMDWITHTTEGPDDMPAHIKAALTQTSLSIPIAEGELMLGTWQGVYLFEHRRAPHRRTLIVHVVGT